MTGQVRLERHDGVALVEIDNPPVNALAHPVRSALLAAVEELDADPTVHAIVVLGAGRQFVAGADVREFDAPPRAPLLNDVLLRLESCRKPVIAALHGAALGGGAEVALASHYRAAAADLSLGFPEIKLGLLPGAGGAVRLPRAVGVVVALEMMTGGESIGRARASELGLVDHELVGDVRASALEYARRLVAEGAAPRRLRDRPAPAAEAPDCAAFRARLPRAARAVPAGDRIVDAVEHSLSAPFEAATRHARELFEACRTSVESRALRHLFLAERARSRHPAAARPVRTAGVVGAGTMGSGITISLVMAGLDVVLVDVKPEVLAAGLAKVHSAVDAAERKGRLAPGAAAEVRKRVRGADTLAALGDADLVIEAVFENLALKQRVFEELGRVARPGAVLATNTSTLDVDAIGAASGRVEDVVGMHFFSPAHVMKLVEVVRARGSGESALATVAALTRSLGKIGVEVANGFGFVGNRMLYAYGREKELVMLEGASPEQVDAALEAFGMAMGPNAVGDLAGLDIGFNVRREWQDKPGDPRFYRVSDLLAERGRYGQKTGRGFYRYEDGKRSPDPEVTVLIREEAARLGVPQREITAAEIVERCTLALVNEGARILGERVAHRAADVDVIWCHGYGFPRTRGGPMFYADTLGLPQVLARIEALADRHGTHFWTPAPLLVALAREGLSFAELDAAGAA
ncbi:MAG: 3-hydroxyacyl-CoA dehydrogenase NAD-binding domain-containing protein [Steroidobacteraceae bacterium]|nr:3-hydroxyacyl-CoA dehydrogenase NAD-binding domain-containing protein [Steroidobacteraceae bacterium]